MDRDVPVGNCARRTRHAEGQAPCLPAVEWYHTGGSDHGAGEVVPGEAVPTSCSLEVDSDRRLLSWLARRPGSADHVDEDAGTGTAIRPSKSPGPAKRNIRRCMSALWLNAATGREQATAGCLARRAAENRAALIVTIDSRSLNGP